MDACLLDDVGIKTAADDEEDEEDAEVLQFPPLCNTPSCGLAFATILVLIITIVLIFLGFHFDAVGPKEMWKIIEYASIPIISVGFTYCHIWVALWLTFYPLKWFGIPGCQIPGTPIGLGFEGIVPCRAEELARTQVELMTTQLLDVKAIAMRLDPLKMSDILLPLTTEILRETMDVLCEKYLPAVWYCTPAGAKQEMVEYMMEMSPQINQNIYSELSKDFDVLMDLEELIVKPMVADKGMVTGIIIHVGNAELTFLRNCGAFWGGVFGLIQMGMWFGMHQYSWAPWVVFPVLGFIVGGFTNQLALTMIFYPIEPRKVCGWTLHGMFLQRQVEVAKEYARMTDSELITPRKVVLNILAGPHKAHVEEVAKKHVKKAMDSLAGGRGSLLGSLAVGFQEYGTMKEDLGEILMATTKRLAVLPEHQDVVERFCKFAHVSWDLRATIRKEMSVVAPAKFERLLHQAFEKDEWMLVLMGAVLGLLIGIFQALTINNPDFMASLGVPKD